MITQKKITQHNQQGCLVVQVGKIQLTSLQSSQFGFTIMESLIAIVVIGILMTLVAPVITLAVATRVQARRVELATQAARTYIDGVRTGAITPPSNTITLNEVNADASKTFNSQRSSFADANVPSVAGSWSCLNTASGYPYCQNTSTSSLYCIDLDTTAGCSSNSNKDLVVQAFRSVNSTSTDANQGYLLGIRIYRADAFTNDGVSLKKTKQSTTTLSRQAIFTGGLGDRKAPLIEMTTEMVTSQTGYGNFCSRLGGCQ